MPKLEPVMSWAVASARPIDLGDETARKAATKRRASWQDDAFLAAEEIGEIRNAYRFQANALSRLRLYAGFQGDPDQPVVPLDPENTEMTALVTPDEMVIVNDVMTRLRSQERDQQQLVADVATQLFLTGEGYLVQRDDDDGERWDFYSVAECVPKPQGWELQVDDAEKLTLTDTDAYLARIHVGSAARRYLPDSAMRTLIGECKTLDLLTRAISAAAMSRLNAGILLIPEEMSFASVAEGLDDAQADTLIEDLIAHFTTPIADPDSAAAVVPFLLKAKRELLDGIKWVSIARDFDTLAVQLRAELIGRLANGLELPTDALTGKGGLNHWTSWSVDEDTFRFYLEPRALLITSALTTAFLRPQLLLVGIEDVRRFRIGYDIADLVAHPNQAVTAKDDWEAGLISDDARRRVSGWGDNDAPDDDELAARRDYLATTRGAPGGAPAAAAETTEPGPPPVAASARTRQRLSRLPHRLVDTERQLRARLLTASDLAVARALERAGARTRAKSKRDATVTAAIQAVDPDNRALCSVLGRGMAFNRLGLTETNLVDDEAFDHLRSTWDSLVGRAQTVMLAEIAKVGPLGGMLTTLEHRAVADRDAGWAIMNGGLLTVGRAHLFGLADSDTPPNGEFDPAMVTPPGIVRRALVAAGSGAGRTTPGGASVIAAATEFADEDVVTGLTNGDLFREAVAAAGARLGPKVWLVGSPTYPFEPHQALDGAEFRSWTNQLLANDEDWPGYDYYFPGDHEFCQCDYLQELEGD